MPLPDALEGVFEQMKFCPRCGAPLEIKFDDPSVVNQRRYCPTDNTEISWECDGDYDYWYLEVTTSEIKAQG